MLVVGQQDRLLRGGDTWRHPVSYDKLAVRYRRWRNSLALSGAATAAAQLRGGGDGEAADAEDAGAAAAAGVGGEPAITMRSGDIFALEDDDHVFVDVARSGSA